MTVLVDEIGAIAAEHVATILSQKGTHSWDALVAAGWTRLASDEDALLGFRDLQEVARVTGRQAVTTPLVTTLLAGRWFDLPPEVLDAGVGVAVARSDDGVVPYITDSMVMYDLDGNRLDPVGVGSDRDDFSSVMPLGLLPHRPLATGTVDRRAELHAALAAVAVGCADTVAQRSVDWVQTREQFGKRILSFQAVRHHLANLHIAREQAWTAAIACAHEPEQAATWSRQACELATSAIEIGIQVHGGVGFTAEVGLHRHLNHVLQIHALLGGTR